MFQLPAFKEEETLAEPGRLPSRIAGQNVDFAAADVEADAATAVATHHDTLLRNVRPFTPDSVIIEHYRRKRKFSGSGMMTLATYHDVLNMARRLERAEQLKLLQALLGEIGSDIGADATKKRSILELKGLGREVWQGVDVEKYIQEERASWDG